MARKKVQSWESFEEVAAFVLNEIKSEFDLQSVEGKQKIWGQTGAEWQIDAKGIKAHNNEAFIIIECRRYTNSKQNQEKMGALAYRIKDAGASGGIVVSPLGLQKGAIKIAQAENIVSVIMDKNSTKENYLLGFLNKVFIRLTENIQVEDNANVKIVNKVADFGYGSDVIGIVKTR